MERRGVVGVSGRELKPSLLQTKEIFKSEKEKEKISLAFLRALAQGLRSHRSLHYSTWRRGTESKRIQNLKSFV